MNQRWNQSWSAPRGASLLFAIAVALAGVACAGSDSDGGTNSARIVSFTSSPERLASAGEVTLSWKTKNARDLSLTKNGDPIHLGDVAKSQGSIEVSIEETSVFELIAQGAVGAPAVRQLTVELGTAGDGPSIATFTGPDAVEADGSGEALVTLSWTGVMRATELVLEAEPGTIHSLDPAQPDGSIEVAIAATTNFTLIARDGGEEVRKGVSVRLVGDPIIKDFSVDRAWVGMSESVTASWTTLDAASAELWLDGVKIEGLDPALVSGSHVLNPTLGATLELRVANEFGAEASDELELIVAAPQVVSFTGDAARIWLGQEVALSWEVRGGTQIVVSVEGGGTICGNTEHLESGPACKWQAPADGTYRFTLTATNASGVDSMDWTLSVGSGPTIEEFSVLPGEVTLGDEVTATWTVLADPNGNAPTLTLEDDHGNDYPITGAQGALQIPLTSESGSFEFTLHASTTDELSTSAEGTAVVLVHGKPSVKLTANPPIFDDSEGDEVSLEWTSENAESLVLFDVTETSPVELLAVPEADRAAGSFTIQLEEARTYRIVATNTMGRAEADEVTVALAPVEVLTFQSDVSEIVVGQPATLSWTTRMSKEISLDLFEGPYVQGESEEAYLDAEALGGIRIPLTTACGPSISEVGCSDVVALDFSFPFGGASRDELRIYSNGFASFESQELIKTAGPNTTFPAAVTEAGAHVHLAPFWDELSWNESRYPTGNIYLLHRDDPVEGASVVIQWKDVGLVAHPNASLNFELILWESGAFEYRYGAMDPGINPSPAQVQSVEGRGATIGYQFPNQSASDVRQFNTTVLVQGSLYGRTFTYAPPPALLKAGSFAWHPYRAPNTASAKLRVERDDASDEKTVSVVVRERPEFRLDQRPPAQIEVGTVFRIGWTSAFTSALEVVAEDGDVLCTATPGTIASGFCNLQETTEGVYRYTVRATGSLGFVTERIVEVKISEPFGIESFEAEETSLEQGQSAALSWVTSGTTTLSLTANGVEIPLSGSPAGPGSVVVPDLDEDTTFVLRGTNAIGAYKEETVLVQMWKVRLTLTPDKTITRPGEPVNVSVEAIPLDGGQPPTIFGTLPMVEVLDGPGFRDISTTPDLLPLVIDSDTQGRADVHFPEGFSFPYFGEPRHSLRVFTSGVLSFDMDSIWTNVGSELPTTEVSKNKVHLAPFWDGLRVWGMSSVWAHLVDEDTFIVQWTGFTRSFGTSTASQYNLNFQVVLHRDGSFEYRYGLMEPPAAPNFGCVPESCFNEANGSRALIGYQALGGTIGLNLHRGANQSTEASTPFPGGLSNRTFRYSVLTGSSEVTYLPITSGTYLLCTMSNGKPACKSFEIEAGFGLEDFKLDAESIGFGGSTTIRWKSHGGTQLTILDDAGATIFSSTIGSEIDEGSVVVAPSVSTTYRLDLTARSNRVISTRDLEVVRAGVQVSSPTTSTPGKPVTISWTLTTPDTALNPVMVTPMEEVQGLDFDDLDLTTDEVGVTEIFAANQPNAGPAREHAFPSGFTFNFLGTPQNRIFVSVRGYMGFDPTLATGNSITSNQMIPTTATNYRKMHLSPFWDELVTFSYGRVLGKLVTPDTYVIQWSDVSLARGLTAANPASLNFMVVLHRNGDFEYRYGAMDPPNGPATGTNNCYPNSCVNEVNGSSASIGYQDPSGQLGHAIHIETGVPRADGWPVPGGLSGRTWKFTSRTGSGAVTVAPWDTSSYMICALDAPTGDFFCPDEPAEIQIDWGIRSFDTTPWSPNLGEPVSLSWEVVGIEELRVLANGILIDSYSGSSVPATKTITHTPTEDTIYTLEARSMDRWLSEPRVVQIKTFDLTVTAPSGNLFPGVEIELGWNFSPRGPGAAAVASPMGEIPAGPGEAGAFVDISTMGGTKLSMSTNTNGSAPVTLPFSFPFLGDAFSGARVYLDGFISFNEAGIANGQPGNDKLPYKVNLNMVHLAPFWDDLEIRGAGAAEGIWTYRLDADTFIIQWKNFSRSQGSSASVFYDLNFQVVLHSNGAFEYRYGKMAPPPQPFSSTLCFPDTCALEANGSSATIGYQSWGANLSQQLHFGGNGEAAVVPFEGGLANRTFRYAPNLSGSIEVKVRETRDYTICGRVGEFYDCRTITIRAVANPGDLMFTELMIDPAGGVGEQWFELRNLSKETIDLEGFRLESNSGSHTISTSLKIAPREFGVFAASTVAGFTPDYVYGAGLGLSTTVDTLELSAGTSTIASQSWGGTWFVPLARSLDLDPQYHWVGTTSNDDFEQWCEGDFEGSPGRLGAGCSNLAYDVDPAAKGGLLDISTLGTRVKAFERDFNQLVKLDVSGFMMPFFTEPMSTVWASSNGWLSFSREDPGGPTAAPPALPTSKNPTPPFPRSVAAVPRGPLLGAFWSSFRCEPKLYDCSFRYYYGEFDGENVLIAEWKNFRYVNTLGNITVQAQLREDGDIKIVFGDVELGDVPDSSYWQNSRGAGSWSVIENFDRNDYLIGHFRESVDLEHRTIHYIVK